MFTAVTTLIVTILTSFNCAATEVRWDESCELDFVLAHPLPKAWSLRVPRLVAAVRDPHLRELVGALAKISAQLNVDSAEALAAALIMPRTLEVAAVLRVLSNPFLENHQEDMPASTARFIAVDHVFNAELTIYEIGLLATVLGRAPSAAIISKNNNLAWLSPVERATREKPLLARPDLVEYVKDLVRRINASKLLRDHVHANKYAARGRLNLDQLGQMLNAPRLDEATGPLVSRLFAVLSEEVRQAAELNTKDPTAYYTRPNASKRLLVYDLFAAIFQRSLGADFNLVKSYAIICYFDYGDPLPWSGPQLRQEFLRAGETYLSQRLPPPPVPPPVPRTQEKSPAPIIREVKVVDLFRPKSQNSRKTKTRPVAASPVDVPTDVEARDLTNYSEVDSPDELSANKIYKVVRFDGTDERFVLAASVAAWLNADAGHARRVIGALRLGLSPGDAPGLKATGVRVHATGAEVWSVRADGKTWPLGVRTDGLFRILAVVPTKEIASIGSRLGTE